MKFVCPSPWPPRASPPRTQNVKLPQSAAYLWRCLQHSLGAIFTFWVFDTRAAPPPRPPPLCLYWEDQELLPKCSWPSGRVGACGSQVCERESLEPSKKIINH